MSKYNFDEQKMFCEMLETSKEMMQMCYSKDGKLQHPIPMIGMMEGISIGLFLALAMQFEMNCITEKRDNQLGRKETDDAYDM